MRRCTRNLLAFLLGFRLVALLLPVLCFPVCP